jgi:hypothetical protein
VGTAIVYGEDFGFACAEDGDLLAVDFEGAAKAEGEVCEGAEGNEGGIRESVGGHGLFLN